MELEGKLKNMMIELEKANERNEKKIDAPSKSICPICQNIGWEIYKDNEGRNCAVECRCGIRKRIIHSNRLKFANLPEAFQGIRLENFKKTVYKKPESVEKIVEAAKAVRYWLKNLDDMKKRGVGLYLYSGTRGSGKTRLIVSIANELINNYDTQVKFATSLKILEEIKKTWDTPITKDIYDRVKDGMNETESKLITDLSTTEVLIIDDFGVEQYKGWIGDKFYSIINGRYNENKITLFTSNLSIDDLPYDSRITSRIKERALQIPFPEESVRVLFESELKRELLNNINEY